MSAALVARKHGIGTGQFYIWRQPLLPRDALDAGPEPEPFDLLDIEDVSAKRSITTALMPSIAVRKENATAAIEVMSRFRSPPPLDPDTIPID